AIRSTNKVERPQPALASLLHAPKLPQQPPQPRQCERLQMRLDTFRVVRAPGDNASPEPKRSPQFPEMNTKVCELSQCAIPLARPAQRGRHLGAAFLCPLVATLRQSI